MRSIAILATSLVAFLAAAGARADGAFTLRSPAFEPGAPIPARYTCEGENVSPPLAWSDPPAGTKSFAIGLADPDAPDPAAPRMTWIHWIAYGLPGDLRALPEDAAKRLPGGARSGRNDWKTLGYAGPCPPIGRHRYVHRIWALGVEPRNWGEPSLAALMHAMGPHILGKAELVGTYEKTKSQQP
jgi:Raf kinase inhibitor-like YbhB/YbcL family protein